jgi:hypothetical protein
MPTTHLSRVSMLGALPLPLATPTRIQQRYALDREHSAQIVGSPRAHAQFSTSLPDLTCVHPPCIPCLPYASALPLPTHALPTHTLPTQVTLKDASSSYFKNATSVLHWSFDSFVVRLLLLDSTEQERRGK